MGNIVFLPAREGFMENGCQVDRLPPPCLASEGAWHLNAKGQNGRS